MDASHASLSKTHPPSSFSSIFFCVLGFRFSLNSLSETCPSPLVCGRVSRAASESRVRQTGLLNKANWAFAHIETLEHSLVDLEVVAVALLESERTECAHELAKVEDSVAIAVKLLEYLRTFGMAKPTARSEEGTCVSARKARRAGRRGFGTVNMLSSARIARTFSMSQRAWRATDASHLALSNFHLRRHEASHGPP